MKFSRYFYIAILSFFIFFAFPSLALEYRPEFIPTKFLGGTPSEIVANLYQYTILGGILLALFYLTLTGFQYILSELPYVKGEAKERFTQIIVGLILLVSIPFILNLLGISPAVKINIGFKAANPATIQVGSGGAGGGGNLPPGPGCNPPADAYYLGTNEAVSVLLLGPGDRATCSSVTQGFSGSSSSYSSTYGCHAAVDLWFPNDSSVYAPADGIVTNAGFNSEGGIYVTIKYNVAGGIFSSTFYHLRRTTVLPGVPVRVGQLIALSDSTGSKTTGPHLHMDLHLSPVNKEKIPANHTALKNKDGTQYFLDPLEFLVCGKGGFGVRPQDFIQN